MGVNAIALGVNGRYHREHDADVLIKHFPTTREYARIFGINEKRLALAKPDVTLLHPGPMNRGLEISWEAGYCDNARIRDEVNNGVATRMAIEFLTIMGGKQVENVD